MIAPLLAHLKDGMAGHPAERALHRFADDELTGQERQRTAAHLLVCMRCRNIVAEVRALGDAARSHDEPMPDLATLRDQVIDRRAAGTRVILSVPQNMSQDPAAPVAAVNAAYTRAAGAWRRLAAAAFVGAIAGASAVGGLLQSFHHGETTPVRVAPVTMGTALDLMGGAGCQAADPLDNSASANAADVGGTALRRLLADEGLTALVPFVGCRAQTADAPPVRDFDGSRVRPMTITYHTRTVVDTVSIASDDRTLAIARVLLHGRAAWNVTEHSSRPASVTTESDSLYLSLTDLRPLRQVSFGSHGARRLRIELTGDTGILHLDGYRERRGADTSTFERPVVLMRQPGATLGPAPIEAILPSLGLRDGWTASVNVLAPQCLICSMSSVGWPGQSFTNQPLLESLRVDGSDRVVVPAGPFDCWRMRVAGGIADGSSDRGVHTIWVSKSAHVIVKDIIEWTESDGIHYRRTRELTHLAGAS